MPEKKKQKTELLTLRISPEIKEMLNQTAEKYSMNASEYVRFLILEDVRKHRQEKAEPREWGSFLYQKDTRIGCPKNRKSNTCGHSLHLASAILCLKKAW